jgi:hypothetical protein
MPLTSFQKEVLLLLAANRNPGSHAGGGAVINRGGDSPRYSADLDLFHDVCETVLVSAEADAAVLLHHGYDVEWLLRQPSLQRAQVRGSSGTVRLDWCYDSAFRFFPVQVDGDFGFCLHRADLATNKVLALAGRSEVRDFIDVLYLHRTYLSLGAMCWAACGKDQGFSPWSLLDYAKRNVKFRDEDLASAYIAQPLSLPGLKEEWMQAVLQAESWFPRMNAADVGCLFVRADGSPFTPTPADLQLPQTMRHFGSLKGAWPSIR